MGIQVIKVAQVVQVVQVVHVVRVARSTSLDDMHSENIWFSWYKPSKYLEKLICHVCDGWTDERTKGGKWKIVQCSVGPETAIQTQLHMQIYRDKPIPDIFLNFGIQLIIWACKSTL